MELVSIFNKIEYKIILLITISLSGLRLYIGNSMPYWYLLANGLDEILLINNANLGHYFSNWTINTLSKNIGYSIFLKFVNITGIPYGVILSLVWIFAGILVVYGVYKYITKNAICLALIYLFIIFFPTGLDLFISARIYRNAIIAPFLILFLSTLYIYINKIIFNEDFPYTLILWSIFLGLIFTFNYYIKEDGMGILIVFLAGLLLALIFRIKNSIKNKKFGLKPVLKTVVLCAIPILIFVGSSFAYSEINYEKFGVHDINTRTDGEIGEFFHNLLLIDDQNKSDSVWVPLSTVEKAWEVSPTLKNHPELLENWKTLFDPHGDSNAWVLRVALANSGLYNDEKSASDFFHKVNNEITEAFDNGNLEKSNKIFISSYAVGRSFNEILSLKDLFFSLLQSSIFYNDFGKDIYDYTGLHFMYPTLMNANESDISSVESFLNMNILTKDEFSQGDNFALNFSKICIHFYQIISIVIVITSIISFILTGIYLILNKLKPEKILLIFLFEIILLGIFVVQLFGVSWFSSFLSYCEYTIAYSSNCQAIFALFEILSISCVFELRHDIIKLIKKFTRTSNI